MMDRLENIKLGALIGAGMGFLYGISSQIPNLIILRDVHLYSKPFDPFINLLVFALAGAVLGVITTWPRKDAYGIVFGGLLGTLLVTLSAYVNSLRLINSAASLSIREFLIFLLVLVLFGILAIMLRWSVSKLKSGYFKVKTFTKDRFIPLLVTFLTITFVGSFSMHSAEVRSRLRFVDAYIKKGAFERIDNALPLAFQGTEGLIININVSYTLESSDNLELFVGERPSGIPESRMGIVRVHFENGFILTCLAIEDFNRVICEQSPPFDQGHQAK